MGDQFSLYRIQVHVEKFLVFLLSAPDVEIVKSLLPKTSMFCPVWLESKAQLRSGGAAFRPLAKAARNALLENLQDWRRSANLRLADEQVDVLGHEHIPGQCEAVTVPDFSQDLHHNVFRVRGGQQREPAVTTESDEMEVALSVVSV